jgi:FAD/FMN-containing dehydrogenase
MERMDRVLEIGEEYALAQGGVMLGALQDEVEARGRLYPPDPTSRHECTLGGSIACNASGARAFAYGPTRDWVDEVEVVLPTGEILEATRDTPIPSDWPLPRWTEPSVKTAVGYTPADNLLDLIVGSEGTLGVVTSARLRLCDRPQRVFSVLALFDSVDRALDLVEKARPRTRVRPRSIEWYDEHSLDLVRRRVGGIPSCAVAAVWCEQEAEDLDQEMEAWLALLEETGALVDDTLFADDDKGLERLRAVRHAVPAAIAEIIVDNGMPKVGTDFAVPDAALRAMMAAYGSVELPHVLFGHVGDNHLHLNLLPRSVSELEQAWETWRALYRLALSFGGTLSAEHGVGKLKREYLAEMVGPDAHASFKALKRHVDPAWILGRGTLIDRDV